MRRVLPRHNRLDHCHPEGRGVCDAKDINVEFWRGGSVEILRLSSSDSLRMTGFLVLVDGAGVLAFGNDD